ncbi:MAG: hypothetical protein K2Q06_11600 [Parvularculaceae bacterium]|nr:hypothetical protein [Parvularculaceae bacterium]
MTSDAEFAWRRPAPAARAAVTAVYGWRRPNAAVVAGLAGALPFALAAALSPALLSLSPTAEMLAPIAAARAVAEGAKPLAAAVEPLQTLLLAVGDLFADAPGRVHLIAKAAAAIALSLAFAAVASVRFPIVATLALAAALAGAVASPYAQNAELAMSLLFVVATIFLAAPAEGHGRRARREGALGAVLLFGLWLCHPVAWIGGVAALTATPFVSDRAGLQRYAAGLIGFLVIAAVVEAIAPGLALARADAVSALFTKGVSADLVAAPAFAGLAMSAAIVIAASAVFGGATHARGWLVGGALGSSALAIGGAIGADPALLLVLAAAIAALSVASPYYDGVFEAHDRASVAIAGTAAGLVLFWAAAIAWRSGGELELQSRVTAEAPADVRSAFALVQPRGAEIARWIEEGRFSTPEAREYFALSPADQAEAFLAAAKGARAVADKGLSVAILTASDAACVLVRSGACHSDGMAAASAAQVVFVPRLNLDPATNAARDRSEALLYTEFRLAAETPFWDVWVKRGSALPPGVVAGAR